MQQLFHIPWRRTCQHAEPMVFGFHKMRAARGRQQMSPAFSRVLRFRMSGRLAGERASWLPPLDSTREIDIILNTSYHRHSLQFICRVETPLFRMPSSRLLSSVVGGGCL